MVEKTEEPKGLKILDDQETKRQLTNLELISKAEEYVETLKLEKAVSLYHEGV